MTLSAIAARILANPYLYSATILARIAVLFATIVWSVLVMVDPVKIDPSRYPVYSDMVAVMPPRAWAGGGIFICAVAFARIWMHCRPHWSGPILYAAIMGFWSYLSASVFFSGTPIPPAAAACILTVALLSVFAFVSNPKTYAAT